jgi:translation initiation factor 3 subunit B
MAVDIDHRAIQRELFPEQPEGYPLEEFDIYDINLPDNDDLGIQSDDDNIDEEDIATETGFGSVVGAFVTYTPLTDPYPVEPS